MNINTEIREFVAPNPFSMLFPEKLSEMAAHAATSSVPSRRYSPLDKPTPKSVRTPQMQAADLLIEAMAEIEDAGGLSAIRHNTNAAQAAPQPWSRRVAARSPLLTRSELVRAVLA